MKKNTFKKSGLTHRKVITVGLSLLLAIPLFAKQTTEPHYNDNMDDIIIDIDIPITIELEMEPEIIEFLPQEYMPKFPGGYAELQKYLSENMQYPEQAKEYGIQGRVICQFVVNEDGSITDIVVVRSVDPSLDQEAKRLMSNMPKWQPGKQRGKAVKVRYTQPINFKLP